MGFLFLLVAFGGSSSNTALFFLEETGEGKSRTFSVVRAPIIVIRTSHIIPLQIFLQYSSVFLSLLTYWGKEKEHRIKAIEPKI